MKYILYFILIIYGFNAFIASFRFWIDVVKWHKTEKKYKPIPSKKVVNDDERRDYDGSSGAANGTNYGTYDGSSDGREYGTSDREPDGTGEREQGRASGFFKFT
jgi:hypothetical protein